MAVDRETQGPVSIVTLDRPDRMNSFDLDHARQLREAVRAGMQADDSDAMVLASTGERAFCTGADLNTFQAGLEEGRARESVHELSTTMNDVILEIVQGEKPVVGCIEGVAAGGGLGLALACDLRVASRKARFTPAFLHAGVSPDGGVTWFLPRMVGQARAREMILCNRTLDAATAHEWGLVSRIENAADTHDAAVELARELASGPRQATRWAKDRLTNQHPLEEHLGYESEATAASAETEAFREGVEAFLEGRKPEFP